MKLKLKDRKKPKHVEDESDKGDIWHFNRQQKKLHIINI